MHLPECVLLACGLSCLCRQPSLRMHADEGEVPPDEADVIELREKTRNTSSARPQMGR